MAYTRVSINQLSLIKVSVAWGLFSRTTHSAKECSQRMIDMLFHSMSALSTTSARISGVPERVSCRGQMPSDKRSNISFL